MIHSSEPPKNTPPGQSGTPVVAMAAPAPAVVPPQAAAPAAPQPNPLPPPPATAEAPPPPAAPAAPGLIDEKARRLAEFFNGEVLPLEEALPGLGEGEEAAA